METISDNGSDNEQADLFQEPEDFYQKDKPATNTTFVLKDGRVIQLRLVGHSPLWVCIID